MRRVNASDVEIKVWCYDQFDREWGWYWTVSKAGVHINGGLAYDDWDGRDRAKTAFYSWDSEQWRQQHIYDVETHTWYTRDGQPIPRVRLNDFGSYHD